jgi:anti-anti-sigma factor
MLKVIKLSGELEIGRKDAIEHELHIEGNERGILLDFGEVTYADSTVLAILLRFHAEARRAGMPIAILIGSRQFARLIEYAGLAHAFSIFTERAAALTHLANQTRQ